MSKLAFGVRYATSTSVKTVEDWLSAHCKGAWDIRLADIDEDRGRKKFDILFEREADKTAFKQAFTHQSA